MARVNVYLPDELAEEAKAAALNVSQVAQEALRAALAARNLSAWLDDVMALPPTGVDDDQAVAAVAAGRDELGL